MLLNNLNENEKVAFISLCNVFAKVNGVVEDAEKKQMEEYCDEMFIEYDESKFCNYDEICTIFSKSFITNKKVILCELIGLIYSDGKMDDIEKRELKKFANKIEVNNELVDNILQITKVYIDSSKKLLDLINS